MSDSVTVWTIAHQAPLSMGFSRQEYWSELPFPPPENLSNPGIKPVLLHWLVHSLPIEPSAVGIVKPYLLSGAIESFF